MTPRRRMTHKPRQIAAKLRHAPRRRDTPLPQPDGVAWGGFFCDKATSGGTPLTEREEGRRLWALAQPGGTAAGSRSSSAGPWLPGRRATPIPRPPTACSAAGASSSAGHGRSIAASHGATSRGRCGGQLERITPRHSASAQADALLLARRRTSRHPARPAPRAAIATADGSGKATSRPVFSENIRYWSPELGMIPVVHSPATYGLGLNVSPA